MSANHIAKWDGNSWSALGGGITSPQPGLYNVSAIAVDVKQNVYIGGSFTSVDGVSANNIAKWDGSKWSALGNGVNSFVNTITVAGDKVYVGGAFTISDGHTAKRLAVWTLRQQQ